MDRPVITALADLLRRHVALSKSRLETMALLTVGMIGEGGDHGSFHRTLLWRGRVRYKTTSPRPRQPLVSCSVLIVYLSAEEAGEFHTPRTPRGVFVQGETQGVRWRLITGTSVQGGAPLGSV